MVLYLKEYAEQTQMNDNYFKVLKYYDKFPEYLHEMNAQDIIKAMNRNGSRGFYIQKAVIEQYLLWLNKNHQIDISQLYYELRKQISSENFEFVGFYDFNDLQQGIQDAEFTIETVSNVNKDYNGLYSIFYLEWLGVLPESALTIKLEDVTDMGKSVYIPAENRTIKIDNPVISDHFWKYKNMTGYKRTANCKHETSYKQTTFYRTTRESETKVKSVYNMRGIFVRDSSDERFAKKRIYYSGRYYEMYQAEMSCGNEFSITNNHTKQIIKEIYNNDNLSDIVITNILRDYKVYKKGYLERI